MKKNSNCWRSLLVIRVLELIFMWRKRSIISDDCKKRTNGKALEVYTEFRIRIPLPMGSGRWQLACHLSGYGCMQRWYCRTDRTEPRCRSLRSTAEDGFSMQSNIPTTQTYHVHKQSSSMQDLQTWRDRYPSLQQHDSVSEIMVPWSNGTMVVDTFFRARWSVLHIC